MTQPPYGSGDQSGRPDETGDRTEPEGSGQQGAYPPPGQGQGGYPPPQQPGYGQGGYPQDPQQGAYPPAPQYGAYGQPAPQGPGAQGAYPPPAQPQYGAYGVPTAPPVAGAGYGAPYGGAPRQQFSVGDAISYGFRHFGRNWGQWVLVVLVIGAVNVLFSYLSGDVQRAQDVLDGNTSAQTAVTFGQTLLQIVGAIVGVLLTACLVNGGLLETAGRRPSFTDFFRLPVVGTVILAGVLVSLLTAVGLVLFVIPGLLVAIFSVFTYHAAIDRRQGATQSIGTSWKLVASKFGSVLGLLVLLLLINMVGALIFGIGLFVTIPVSYIASAYAYRGLSGQLVAP